jgi:glycolate oxidase FAD binding subunit
VIELLEPRTGREVAEALKRAADARRSIVISGAGTKREWGRPAGRVDAVLDMRGLNRVLAHQHGDMTATVEAGATLRDVNRALARHGQWLPLDPPRADEATIGGILATNDSGPLRHRYGTPRDLVIGIQLATTDGVLAKAGGQVVKNVAGYDLSKLVAGSFGSLAAIVSATFKLAPLPAASKTLAIELPAAAALAPIVRAVMSSQLEPIAFEIGAHAGRRVLIRFASLPAVVDAQVAQASAGLRAAAPSDARFAVVDGAAEQDLWREHSQRIWSGDGAIVRVSWLPANIDAVVDEVRPEPDVSEVRLQADASEVRLKPDATYSRDAGHGGDVHAGDLIGRAAIGAGLARIGGDADAQARAVERLRASATVGNVVIVRGSAELKARVDVWGSHGDRQPLFDALKRTLDPHNVLNAGRGPL